MRLARADVFADEMRLGDGHVKFRRLVAGIGRRVFDDETFLARHWPLASAAVRVGLAAVRATGRIFKPR